MKTDKKVWIIDDDPSILEVVQIIVAEEGYKTKVINNGELLQKELNEEYPHLILLDILMAGIDGRDIAKAMKKDPLTNTIPIIIMSADIHVDKISTEAHADGYLRKPFNINDLVEILKKYLR